MSLCLQCMDKKFGKVHIHQIMYHFPRRNTGIMGLNPTWNGCGSVFFMYLCCHKQAKNLKQANPLSKESYQISKNRIPKLRKWGTLEHNGMLCHIGGQNKNANFIQFCTKNYYGNISLKVLQCKLLVKLYFTVLATIKTT